MPPIIDYVHFLASIDTYHCFKVCMLSTYLSVIGGREAPLCVSDSCCLFITLIIFPGKNDYEPLDNFNHACMKLSYEFCV